MVEPSTIVALDGERKRFAWATNFEASTLTDWAKMDRGIKNAIRNTRPTKKFPKIIFWPALFSLVCGCVVCIYIYPVQ